MAFTDYIARESLTLQQAMDNLQQSDVNEVKLLFIVDGALALKGVVTDGDVRRFLLAGGSLGDNIMRAANQNPISFEGFSEPDARALMKQKAVTCVPMTRRGTLHALVFRDFTLHRELERLGARVAIMAGGFGTRLEPYTRILPKPLIPVGQKTITEQVIERFKKFGCYDISLIVNYRRELIKAYFSEVDTGANISFLDEDEPLGTGGGLYMFKGKTNGKPLFVTYCDNVIEADYADILKTHIEQQNAVTMVCAKLGYNIPYGVVETDDSGALLAIREKPRHSYLMNTGFYVVGDAFLARVEDNAYQPITDVFERCVQDGLRVGTYAIEGSGFIDVGQLDDLRSVEDKIK